MFGLNVLQKVVIWPLKLSSKIKNVKRKIVSLCQNCLLLSSGVVLFHSSPLNYVTYFVFYLILLISGASDIILHDSWQHRLCSTKVARARNTKHVIIVLGKSFFYNTMTLFLARHIYSIFLRTLWIWNLWMYRWFYDPQLIFDVLQTFLPNPQKDFSSCTDLSQKSPNKSL